MNGEEPRRRRRMTILMLPNDLVYNCLARVSRLYYPILSLVSKRFRSLLASTELYQTRTLLGRTECCLYVCLRLHSGTQPLRWFTLSREPINSTKTLVPISSPNSPSALWSDAVMVGPNIYAIGGLVNDKASSSVMVMDCRSHTWREAPPMRVAREFHLHTWREAPPIPMRMSREFLHSACVLDGKIYVPGGSKDLDLTNWMEVFDTKTQTWEFFQIPSKEIFGGSMYLTAVYEGTFFVKCFNKHVMYKVHKGRWRAADIILKDSWGDCRYSCYCVIENVFYRYNDSKINWYDFNDRVWKTLKGFVGLPSLTRFSLAKMVDYRGKMALLWEEHVFVDNRKETRFWCAEVAIEKRDKQEIWGVVEWSGIVSTTNKPYSLAHVLATTI
ncbi:PREDICTED: F-box/kelch-repeat protein At4g23580-like [Camelina sativa]|uniref:F-box/kelch-repeat protein At4g23580-like n=1 Tax=Camelina sativa TaxID=90675 RepID=A0ABM0W217_CAMSA|nr:PREDICTED: F-box/kelch-repeat protein At4g23580-like [Camelina sativa]